MGTMYLDERNTVRFDQTKDGQIAARARWNRDLLDMLSLLDLMREKADELRSLTGRTPLDPTCKTQIAAFEAEVWQRSIATTVPLDQ